MGSDEATVPLTSEQRLGGPVDMGGEPLSDLNQEWRSRLDLQNQPAELTEEEERELRVLGYIE